MSTPFTKMQGTGNDFAVIDATKSAVNLPPKTIKKMANRHYGIGFDQLLLIEPAQEGDFIYRIFNADGTEAEQCGNGARCVARYIADHNLSDKTEITLNTKGGLIKTFIEEDDLIRVDMGQPQFDPKMLPSKIEKQQLIYDIEVGGAEIKLGLVSMGNPHAVICVDNLDTVDIAQVGEALGTHTQFPKGINVGFMQVTQPYQVQLQVYERGSGETLACGSAACAAVIYGHKLGILEREVNVIQPGGELLININTSDGHIHMTGPAETLYQGQWLAM